MESILSEERHPLHWFVFANVCGYNHVLPAIGTCVEWRHGFALKANVPWAEKTSTMHPSIAASETYSKPMTGTQTNQGQQMNKT
jgi:hypothetical protein